MEKMDFKAFLGPNEQTIDDIVGIYEEFRKRGSTGDAVSSAILTLAAVIENSMYNAITDYCESVHYTQEMRKQHEIQVETKEKERQEREEREKNFDPERTAERIRQLKESLKRPNTGMFR